ncbi:MAG: hypothetical protein HOC91_18110 [Nitrospinaceae bacterium]|jgi:hypothetical protein|nr:hypothetical protein [Nitrospinaceae bacterium]MBT3434730.1 hypothetical protein [Nitrospinaceae bacterium]MBT3821082.1 hypothetical protein [Nitrospinaceae bacterium]MBT4093487.1 hypothetical protein [Nitrospinaceae bacterium]MBT4432429.1 hypothetical protein [Nitrospinaceae bacterium]
MLNDAKSFSPSQSLSHLSDKELEANFLELVRKRRLHRNSVDVVNIEYSMIQIHEEMSRRSTLEQG